MGNREGILWRILHRENIKGRRRREDVLNRARLKVGEIKTQKVWKDLVSGEYSVTVKNSWRMDIFMLIIIISILLQKINWHFMSFDKKK